MKQNLKVSMHPSITLMIVMTGKEKIITLTVDDTDILTNTDSELDRLLETTFRRNQITAGDIKKWEIKKTQLVEMSSEQEKVLHEFDTETVLNVL